MGGAEGDEGAPDAAEREGRRTAGGGAKGSGMAQVGSEAVEASGEA